MYYNSRVISFKDAYKALNKDQKEAVDSIDGPVMVVAGPGTGKTQVLALRIANIISSDAQISPNYVLCLTFTNAGVKAMRERLLSLIGAAANEVQVSTFHRFALNLIEKNYELLGFEQAPMLMADAESIALVDEILENNEWHHIRPRGDSSKYFSDLKSIISLTKREAVSPEDFLIEIEKDIKSMSENPDNISSRGARKGELKMEIVTKIASLERTREVVLFYEKYEALKKDRGYMDYDDVLAYAVTLAQTSEDVRADLRENHQYILVDEHQDSSGVQNAFLEAVWSDTEKPNIFVVGDDRQLIYGFGGASLSHFTNFRTLFGKAKEITLVQNYRSTQTILDAADALLKSTLATAKLQSNKKGSGDKLVLRECAYPRDEIIYIANEIAQKIAKGESPDDFAILVPKNYQVRSVIEILRDQNIPVVALGNVSFFSQKETLTIRNILSALSDPYDSVAIAALLLDPAFEIPPLTAHKFLRENVRKINLETLIANSNGKLFIDPLIKFGMLMGEWLACSQTLGIHTLIQKIGEDLFFNNAKDHELLVRRVEIIRTYLHILDSNSNQGRQVTLSDFLKNLARLEQYGHEIPMAVFSGAVGVRVLTLHGSKGLEFENVYIAHLDQSSLMKGKRSGFVLPERIDSMVEIKNEMTARRELYVAITRAKTHCTMSFARQNHDGSSLEQASIISDIPEEFIEYQKSDEMEKEIIARDPKIFISRAKSRPKTSLTELAEIVKNEYSSKNVSVTLLNNFFECPWKWYFRNLLQLPEMKTESLLLGSAVHAGIEYLIKGRDEGNFEQLDFVVMSSIEKENISDQKMVKRMAKEAHKILDNFIKIYLPQISENAKSERSISYRDPKWPHLSFYGKIDLTESEENGFVQVTDFKTGSGKSKSVIEKRDEEGRLSSFIRQLAMYTYLISGAERNTEVTLSKLLFLEEDSKSKDAVYATRITGEEMELLRKDFADYDSLLKTGEWVRRTCYAKTYGKNTECEHCTKAKTLYQ